MIPRTNLAGYPFAWCALASIGRTAIPTLAAMLKDTNDPCRYQAMCAFEWKPGLATRDPAVVPLLIRCLTDPDPSVRVKAIGVIGRLPLSVRPDVRQVFSRLTNSLALGNSIVEREVALATLTEYSEKSPKVAAYLLNLSVDDDLRAALFRAYEKIPGGLSTNAPPE